LVMMLYDRLEASPAFAIVVTVGMTVALLLLALGAWRLAQPHLTRANAARAASIVALALALTALGLSPIWILFAAATLGALWPSPPDVSTEARQ
jgi:chromate transport protein ChrA